MLRELVDVARFIRERHTSVAVPEIASPPVSSSVEAVQRARSFAAAVLAGCPAPHACGSAAVEGAVMLMAFLADPPLVLLRQWEEPEADGAGCARAWDEPMAGAHDGLRNLVQDIWEHCLGPEATEDDCIVSIAGECGPRCGLDFGAGAGHFASALARAGCHVDAIETDPVKRLFLERRARDTAWDGSVRVVSHPHSAYGLVLAINVLDHIEEPLPVLEDLIGRMGDDARLLVCASFPADGWHRGIDAAVHNCGEALVSRLSLRNEYFERAPLLQVWSKRAMQRDVPSITPQLRAHSHRVAVTEEGGTILGSPLFFARAMVLSKEGARLASAMDGSRNVSELAAGFGLDELTIQDFAEQLVRNHLAMWR